MKRTLLKLALIAASSFALAACTTAPAKPEPAPAPVAPKKTIVEMEYELRMKEIEAQTAREERAQKAAIKFAAESNSEFAQGFVAATLVSAQKQAAAEPQRRSLLDAVNQEEERELRRAELAERNSAWNRGLQVVDRAIGFKIFSKGLEQERYRIDQANSQQRYLFGALRGTQQDAYSFSSGAYQAGASATLGGFNAARSMATPPAPEETDPSTETPAE